jgi:spermidine synthase
MHGGQYLDDTKALEPVTYYHREGPVGRLLTSPAFDFKRVGIVGLGVGGIAAYGRQGQSIDYYEIDPEVQSIASKFFSYVHKTPADVHVIIGDARLNLARASGKEYDLIIIDAFSGDSIPLHLITAEAIQTYRSRLAVNGIILVHISNRYLDLVPVLYSNASYLGGYAILNKSDVSSTFPPICASHWVTLTWEPSALKVLVEDLGWKREYRQPVKRIRPWTDDFVNILAVLRVKALVNTIRFFQPFSW